MKIDTKTIKKLIFTKQDFILKHFIPMPKSTLCMISAKGGIGKTNLSLMIASEYVLNHQGNVALWLTEDEEGNIKYRFNTLINHKIIRPFNESKVHYILNSPVHFAKNDGREFKLDEEVFDDLKLFCVENDIRLLVLDPLIAFFGGNENDNGHARIFMQPFINWCKELDITIILIHHASKGEVTNTRGAGAFIDAVRIAYTISHPMKKGLTPNHVVEDEESYNKGFRTIKCVKDNRGAMRHIQSIYETNTFNIQIAPALTSVFKVVETEYVEESFNENNISIY